MYTDQPSAHPELQATDTIPACELSANSLLDLASLDDSSDVARIAENPSKSRKISRFLDNPILSTNEGTQPVPYVQASVNNIVTGDELGYTSSLPELKPLDNDDTTESSHLPRKVIYSMPSRKSLFKLLPRAKHMMPTRK